MYDNDDNACTCAFAIHVPLDRRNSGQIFYDISTCSSYHLLSYRISSSKPVLTFLRLCPEVDASNLVLASRLSSPDVLLYFLHLHLLGALGMMDEWVVWFSVALLDLRCLGLVILCCVQDATTKRSVWNAFFLNMFEETALIEWWCL